MSTLVEALSVVIPRHVLDAGYPGGTEGYLDTARRARGARYAICDERLACVSFASPADADSFTAPLLSLGLGAEDGAPPPVACLDEDFGPTAACPWLRWRRHDDGFTSCWLEWTEPGELVTPTGWLPPRQRAAAGRPIAVRPLSPPPVPADVAPAAATAVPDAPPPLRIVPTAVGPLTPISSPAILAAMGGSQGGNGHGFHDGDFGGLDSLVATAEQAAADSGDATSLSGDADQMIGDRWSLPEFDSTDGDADDDATNAFPSEVTSGTADVADVDDMADDDMADMDALIAVLPTDVEPADADTTAAATEPSVEEPADAPNDDGDESPPWAVGRGAAASEDPLVHAAADDAVSEAIDDATNDTTSAATDHTVDDVVDSATDSAADDAADDDEPAIPDAGWTGVLEAAHAAFGAIADAADASPAGFTDDDVEALFEAGELYAPTAPGAETQSVASGSLDDDHADTAATHLSASLTPAAMTAVAPAPAPAPAASAPSLDAVRAHLAERGWRYSQDADQGALFYQTAGGRASYPGFAAADESAKLVWLYTQIPVRVPEHRRPAAVELLTRANHGLAVGNFEFDYTDGEVRFKTVADTADGCFSPAAAGRLLRHGLDACDRYHDALMQVIYGGLSPAEAVR